LPGFFVLNGYRLFNFNHKQIASIYFPHSFRSFFVVLVMPKESLNKYQIFDLLRKNEQIIQNFGVEKIGLFGSFVLNHQTPESDIDLLVQFKKGKKTYKNFIQLAFFLEKIFGKNVDLLTEQSLSPFIGKHILNEAEYVSIGS
jgi:predicted nucleotidyltransferase